MYFSSFEGWLRKNRLLVSTGYPFCQRVFDRFNVGNRYPLKRKPPARWGQRGPGWGTSEGGPEEIQSRLVCVTTFPAWPASATPLQFFVRQKALLDVPGAFHVAIPSPRNSRPISAPESPPEGMPPRLVDVLRNLIIISCSPLMLESVVHSVFFHRQDHHLKMSMSHPSSYPHATVLPAFFPERPRRRNLDIPESHSKPPPVPNHSL